MWAALEGLHDMAGCCVQGGAAGDHMFRGQIALHAAIDLHVGGPPFRGHGIVECDAIGPGGAGKTDIAMPRLAGERDDGQAGVAAFQGGDDAGGGFHGENGEILTFE